MDTETIFIILIYTSVVIGLLWALINGLIINSIDMYTHNSLNPYGEKQTLIVNDTIKKIEDIGEKISDGANAFLKQEYSIMTVFIFIFSVVIFLVVDYFGQVHHTFTFYATIAFILGSFTSMFAGFIGMRIAVRSNYRTTFKAMSSLEEAFRIAYRAGCVMGFATVSLGLGLLTTLFLVYVKIFDPVPDIYDERSYSILMELLAGFGLGGSAMALFGRVGGGIYTKAADVGADLVGKIEENLEEDSPKNPATIADNVGDNVGDIAGMGSDLFGSFAESSCAALVLIANTPTLIGTPHSLYFPLLITAGGLFTSFLTSIIGIYIYKVKKPTSIAFSLNFQLLLSTLLSFITIFLSVYSLPSSWIHHNHKAYDYYAVICASLGLLSGFFIGMSTDYYTSYSYKPVREMAKSCTSGAAINIIYGLALGYVSTIIPIILIAIIVIVSISLLGMLGVALAAVGMLSNLAISLAIDTFGPISDNAGGIAEMTSLGHEVREITDALDSAGNTTAAIGKGFAIGSASLVSLALYGAFVTRAQNSTKNPIKDITVTNPWIFGMFFIGAMLPYAFSALTMKSVGKTAEEMVEEIKEQFKDPRIKTGEIEPDYQRCIQVSTKASLREMVLPAILVMVTPLFFGILFHPVLVAGLLPGALISGVQLAISMSNTGGAWDNCKKYIESGNYVNAYLEPKGKGSKEHKAAVIGDTVGDPLKDTSGPSLNILIKLMAIISLVFAGGFSRTSFLAHFLHIEV